MTLRLDVKRRLELEYARKLHEEYCSLFVGLKMALPASAMEKAYQLLQTDNPEKAEIDKLANVIDLMEKHVKKMADENSTSTK